MIIQIDHHHLENYISLYMGLSGKYVNIHAAQLMIMLLKISDVV